MRDLQRDVTLHPVIARSGVSRSPEGNEGGRSNPVAKRAFWKVANICGKQGSRLVISCDLLLISCV